MGILKIRDENGNIQEILAIRGEAGKDGNTPVRGVDYWTDADKAEIIKALSEDVLGDIDTALDSIIAIQNELIGGATLITFTIDGVTYQAENGMTWGEWVESEYNTGNLYWVGDQLQGSAIIRGYVCLGTTQQRKTDIIINGTAYVGYSAGGDVN